MTTKECRHCKEQIHTDARICHYCHCYQVWWANGKDARYQALMLAVWAIFAVAIIYSINTLWPDPDKPDPPANIAAQLELLDSSARFTESPDGLRFIVIGSIRSKATVQVTDVWFRVNLESKEGERLDSLLLQQNGLHPPPGQATLFRLYGTTVLNESEIGRTDVSIESAKLRSTWDY